MSSKWAFAGLLLIAFIWGSTFAIAKEVLTVFGPLQYISLRFGITALAALVLWGRSLRHTQRKTVWHGIGLGILLGIGFLTQTVGLAWTTASKSAFITGLSVPLVPLFGSLLGWTRLHRGNLIGTGTALVGFFLLCYPTGGFSDINSGDVVSLACTVAFALHILGTERSVSGSNVAALNVVQLFVCAIFLGLAWGVLFSAHLAGWPLPTAFAREVVIVSVPLKTGIQFCFLALITLLCYRIQTAAQRQVSATSAALIFSLEPVFATALAFLMLHETLGWRAGIGGALTVAAVFISELHPAVALPAKEPAPPTNQRFTT
ncbi:MAG: DMT family transporter [Blastocatellia bacterium]|nr:DMT family transporter [Blastocatellia bacterium]